jgi:FkbM family methyltransferase
MDTCDKLVSEESFKYFTGNIKEDYFRLIEGLDAESIKVVVRVLSRIQNYRKEKTSYFWFTEHERTELAKIHDLHFSSIVKLADSCYAYGKYLLPRRIISTTIFYYNHFVDMLAHIEKLKNKEIIDVGGFIGDSAVILAKYTNKNVHVFEPVSSMYDLCQQTVELNKLKNVVLNKTALGSKTELKNINLAGDTSTLLESNQFNGDRCKQESVEIITLDDYVAKNQLQVGLIKVDVEGFEQEFLRGAEQTIKTQRPALLLSIYHNADDFFKIKPLIESWNLGYKFKITKPSDLTILIDTTLIAEVED